MLTRGQLRAQSYNSESHIGMTGAATPSAPPLEDEDGGRVYGASEIIVTILSPLKHQVSSSYHLLPRAYLAVEWATRFEGFDFAGPRTDQEAEIEVVGFPKISLYLYDRGAIRIMSSLFN